MPDDEFIADVPQGHILAPAVLLEGGAHLIDGLLSRGPGHHEIKFRTELVNTQVRPPLETSDVDHRVFETANIGRGQHLRNQRPKLRDVERLGLAVIGPSP